LVWGTSSSGIANVLRLELGVSTSGDGRVRGESYKAEVYDDLIPQLLDRVQIGAATLTQVIGGLTTYPDTTFLVARVQRERELAVTR
jgi:hypothetical protein